MKLLQINTSLNSSSTGKIASQIGEICLANGHESFIMYSGRYPKINNKSITNRIGNKFDFLLHALITRIFDKHGFASKRATLKLIKNIDRIQPDIIHLHNLHGYYLNIKILFEYLTSTNSRVVCTLHDCWNFTGHCSHFEYVGCSKWKNYCNDCPQKSVYPASVLKDNSEDNYEVKKLLFNSIGYSKMVMVPVSFWLQGKLKKSFLKNFDSRVIQNGIDLNIFKPKKENIFEKKLSIKNQFILLGVASVWTQRKGFDEFIKLSKYLDNNFVIVLVGVDSKLQRKLPDNIILIERTSDQEELASIYSDADLYLNLTFEDTYPSTNLESIACGTPIITYKTGGSPESIINGCGCIIEQGNIEALARKIKEIKNNNFADFPPNKLISASKNYFDKDKNFIKYLDLYEEILQIER
jgi:putative colanic acid biosynthesis glycosyltransferase